MFSFFGIKYFVSYKIPKDETRVLEGWDIIKPPMFVDLLEYLDAYAAAVAEANDSDPQSVIITQLNKVN